MTGSDSDAWARLRLAQGRSNAELWELVGARGHTTLTVGSGTGCSWSIQEQGVAPIHFSLHWDGSTLRVADTNGAGNLRLDGVPVTREWRVVSGRARIDFAHAAIVVETSAGSAFDEGHPLDRGPPGDSVERPVPKGTLLGVAPLTARGAPIMASVPAHVVSPASAPQSSPSPSEGQADSFRPKRPGDSVRPAKPTLVGVVTSASVPPRSVPQVSAATPAAATPSRSKPTLKGVSDPGGRSGRASRGSLAGGDQHTLRGFPVVHPSEPTVTIAMGGSSSSAPPTGEPGAVTRARVRHVSDPVPPVPPETWPTDKGIDPDGRGSADANPVPQAVLLGAGSAPKARGGHQRSGAPDVDDDVASFEPRRASRGFLWGYLALGALTAAAYAAWLYLLDHL